MKCFNELMKFHFVIFMKTNKIVMPVLLWIVFMGTAYSTMPLEIVSSFIVSLFFLYILMTCISLSYTDSVDVISEQVLIFKVGNENRYYLSKVTFLIILGTIASLIGILFPLMKDIILDNRLFSRAITIQDLGCAFILHVSAAILGIVTGMLFQPRIIKDRKKALLYTGLFVVMAMVKIQLVKEFSIAKFIAWIFPPLADITNLFSGKKYFYFEDITKAIIYVGVYSIVVIIINIYLLRKNKF